MVFARLAELHEFVYLFWLSQLAALGYPVGEDTGELWGSLFGPAEFGAGFEGRGLLAGLLGDGFGGSTCGAIPPRWLSTQRERVTRLVNPSAIGAV